MNIQSIISVCVCVLGSIVNSQVSTQMVGGNDDGGGSGTVCSPSGMKNEGT